jgi:hypothetical protein
MKSFFAVAATMVFSAAISYAAVLTDASNMTVKLNLVQNIGSTPIDAQSTPANSSMLYVASYASGSVVGVNTTSGAQTPFLTLPASITLANADMQGITFSPDYGDPTKPGYHKFYTYQEETRNSAGGTSMFTVPEVPTPANVDTVREWTANANGLTINNASSRVVWSGATVSNNGHNGGGIRFGTDGYLYFTVGDGGGSGSGYSGSIISSTDGFTGNNNAGNPVLAISNGQDFTNVGGKLFRIDPYVTDASGNPIAGKPNETLKTFGGQNKYFIPNTNPFVGNPNNLAFRSNGSSNPPVTPLPEIFAEGFRNPFKLTIDNRPGGNGSIYEGDVGDHAFEEINKITAGGDYGWPYREGNIIAPGGTKDGSGNVRPGADTSSVPWLQQTTANSGVYNTINPTLLDPLTEFKTRYTTTSLPTSNFDGDGNAIVGGFIYRGSAIPQLTGMYIFGTYQFVVPDSVNPSKADSSGGRLFYFDPNGQIVDPATGLKQIYEFNYLSGFGITQSNNGDIYGFGEDPNGELYVLFGNGDVKLISSVPEPATWFLMSIGAAGLFLARKRVKRNRELEL